VNDGIDFKVQKLKQLTRRQQRKWYSHKHNDFGIKYEVATCIKTGDIVHYYGPVRASIHDIDLYRIGLRPKLAAGERVIADKGYRGDRKVCTPFDFITNSAQHKRVMQTLGMRHETVNGRFKFWRAL
jgi:hypothetical protein